MPIFLNTAAFWGILSVFALIGIYLFRNRSKKVVVSSIMLWRSYQAPSEGGHVIDRPPLTLLLILEILILLMFVLSAAGPRVMMGESVVPLIIILDDSFSMGSGTPHPPRKAAERFIKNVILTKKYYRISLLKSGTFNKYIGRRNMTPNEASQLLSNWKCRSAYSNISEAIKTARNSSLKSTQIVVVTDHKPSSKINPETWWLSFGSPTDNLAITKAKQYTFGNQARNFIEFTNFSAKAKVLKAKITNEKTNKVIKNINIKMSPGSVRQFRMTIPNTTTQIKAEILNDDIKFDNIAYILPEVLKTVSCKVAIKGKSLSEAIFKTLRSLPFVKITENPNADLLFLENSKPQKYKNAQFIFHSSNKPVLVTEPIFVDKSHVICDGLDIQPCYWAFAPKIKLPGHPLLSTGNNILLSISGNEEDGFIFDANLSADFSNFQDTVAWPILFYNIVSYVSSFKEGPQNSNVRAGTPLKFNFGQLNDNATIEGGRVKELIKSLGNTGDVTISEPGKYTVKCEDKSWTVAINVLSEIESDMRAREIVKLGNGLTKENFIKKSSNATWWFLIPGILLLGLHQWILSRRSLKTC